MQVHTPARRHVYNALSEEAVVILPSTCGSRDHFTRLQLLLLLLIVREKRSLFRRIRERSHPIGQKVQSHLFSSPAAPDGMRRRFYGDGPFAQRRVRQAPFI